MAATSLAPILVTGSHRSGSTWVGRTLAQAPGVAYLDEPFGRDHRPGVLRTRFPHWFPYVPPGSDGPLEADVRGMLEFRYGYGAELRALRSPRDAARMARDAASFARFRAAGARPLLKDPVAILAAPWLAETFGVRVLVLIRHPAAFASSIKRLGWWHPFGDFLAQPRLMEERLAPFRARIEQYAASPPDLIDQANLLWNIIHSVIAGYRREHPGWLFARHEDLSSEPVAGFRRLTEGLGLPYTDAVDAFVRRSTGAGNPAEARTGVAHQLQRDSAANIANWKTRLTAEEVARVRAATEEVAAAFYDERSW